MDFHPDHRLIPEIPNRISQKLEKSGRNLRPETDPSHKSAWISRCLEGQGLRIG